MQNILYYVKKYGRDAILFSLLIALIFLSVYNIFIKKEVDEREVLNELVYTNEDDYQNTQSEVKNDNIKVFVDIKGAVKKPGVYEVDGSAIVNDIIKLAGGFNSNAYQNGINLSKKVNDEMVIYVYTKSEISKYQTETNKTSSITDEVCKVPDYSICECVDDKKSVIVTDENSSNDKVNKTDNETTIVNINTASVNELMTLTGIGESKALAIIKYREDNGKYTKPEDIMNVSGIGEKAFEKIKDFITV